MNPSIRKPAKKMIVLSRATMSKFNGGTRKRGLELTETTMKRLDAGTGQAREGAVSVTGFTMFFTPCVTLDCPINTEAEDCPKMA